MNTKVKQILKNNDIRLCVVNISNRIKDSKYAKITAFLSVVLILVKIIYYIVMIIINF